MKIGKLTIVLSVGAAALLLAGLAALNHDYDARIAGHVTKSGIPLDQKRAIFEQTREIMNANTVVIAMADRRGFRVVAIRDDRRQDRRLAALTEHWSYCYPPENEIYIVWPGFETDYASVPKEWAWLVYALRNEDEAAIIHDWLYAVGADGERKKSDGILRFAMFEQKVPAWKRNLMYLAVRVGGASAYGDEAEWRFRNTETTEPLAVAPVEKSEVGEPIRLPCSCQAEYRRYFVGTLRMADYLKWRRTQPDYGTYDPENPSLEIVNIDGYDELITCINRAVPETRVLWDDRGADFPGTSRVERSIRIQPPAAWEVPGQDR